jgi:hypothetical protein
VGDRAGGVGQLGPAAVVHTHRERQGRVVPGQLLWYYFIKCWFRYSNA